ncbi:unnamed protein product [Closterium sp. Yama58-4]|nr:unnamed protein product [Closterium sp. Yama58-4]
MSSSLSARTYWCHQCATVASIGGPLFEPAMAGPRCPACGGGFVEELPAAALAGPAALHPSPARANLSLADAWADMRSVLAHRSQRLRADPESSRSSSPDIGGSAAIAREAASPPTSPSPSDGGEASTEPSGGVFGDYGDGEDGLARFLRDMREESSFLEVATAQLRARSAPMNDTARRQVRVGDGGSGERRYTAAAGGGGGGELSGRVGDYFLGDDFSALVDRIATAHPAAHTSTHTPASRAAVRALPLRIVREEDVEGGVEACAVCHEDMGVGAVTQQLPCRHAYHSDCILPWLAQSNSCPVCRFRLPSQAEADAADACPWNPGALLGGQRRQRGNGGRGWWDEEEVEDGVAWWRGVDGNSGGRREGSGGGMGCSRRGRRARQLGGERLGGTARQQGGEGGRQGSSAREGMSSAREGMSSAREGMRSDAVPGRREGTGGGEGGGEAGPLVGGAGASERPPAAESDGLAVWRRDLIGAARGTVFADRGRGRGGGEVGQWR